MLSPPPAQTPRVRESGTGAAPAESRAEITYGRVPAGSVVVSGSLPAADGSHSLYCAIIVKRVDEKTRAKIALNELIRLAE